METKEKHQIIAVSIVLIIFLIVVYFGTESIKEQLKIPNAHLLSLESENSKMTTGTGFAHFEEDVVAVIKNTGDSGRIEVELQIDGSFEERKIVEIQKDETIRVAFYRKSYTYHDADQKIDKSIIIRNI